MRSLSMGSCISSLFSISTNTLTPSITICTSSTSEKPSLSELEMSKTPSTASVSTPPVWTNDQFQCYFKLPQTRGVGSCLEVLHAHRHADQCPDWMGKSECSQGVHST
uniref:Uncharacterized protein n=1 Tax=Hippocampus comes TaxID=109280 RepID=A0A3Q2XTL2_HIPCM